MYKILENGQIMQKELGNKYILWKPIGMEKQVKRTDNIHQWQIFDLNLGKYVDDVTNTTTIVVNDVEYIPIDGKVEIVEG